MSHLSANHFHDEEAAYAFVEARVWPTGPVCPHCGGVERISKMKGTSTRIGAYKCYQCRKPFTVKIGTIFEASHVKMNLWLQAIYLMSASKKGISANQLHRTLDVTLKTAWFMSHRIREAMRSNNPSPMGSNGGAVEVDETFLGTDKTKAHKIKKGRRIAHMNKVLSLVDRETGAARSVVINEISIASIAPVLEANIAREARLMTDEAGVYKAIGWNFADHGSVNHGKDEYVSRADRTVHTNTIEGYFSIFKRGMKGIYQHCSSKHLHRYLAEFDFRYSNRQALGTDDAARANVALLGVVGKRLKYAAANGEA
ncbi:IS1595 family transposase [Oleomonas cavernae]|uniref:IS1595 family transposase n=1 Tax=Oleomonas cavernae TaxID=2320859 RepID=A0A418VU99_9PROT|nr:IS1595 family transposase [Oleomonas cavernae]RJF80732.1 IS1595 family transposase [Oleomonas cavernae]